MLQLARVESGQQVLHIVEIEVQEIVDDVLRGFRTVAAGKSVSLLQTGASELMIRADVRHFRPFSATLSTTR
jgi:signal transduction histidine kinase